MRRDSSSPSSRLLRVALALVAAALAACSTGVRLGYNNADTLLLYAIDGYVGLSAEQDALVRERAGALLAWHRTTQLRETAQLVDAARRKLAGPITPADVLQFNEAINAQLVIVGDKALPDLAQFALTLTPEQLARLERKFAGDNRKARKELVQFTGNDALEQRVQKTAERAEFWLGRLTPEQLAIIRSTLARRPSTAAWWQDERERRQRELVAVLQRIRTERPSEATAATWLRAYLAELQAPADAARRAAAEASRQNNAELVAQIVNAASPEQKSQLARRLGGFADDLAALAGERAPRPG